MVRVVDQLGEAVSGAQAALVDLARGEAAEGMTDARGVCSLRPPAPEGPLQLVVHRQGFLAHNETRAAADDETVLVRLRRRPLVRGLAVDAGSGAAVTRLCIALLPHEGPLAPIAEPPPGARWIEAADGAFAAESESEGPHVLVVFAQQARPHQQALMLRGDEEASVSVRLERGVRLRGRVRDASGQPVADASVRLTAADGAVAFASTDAAGGFWLPPVAPGAAGLFVQPDALPFLERAGLVLDGADPEPFVELQLPPGCTLRGRVEPWTPGSLAEVVVAHERGPARRLGVETADGTFAAAGLPAGRCMLRTERTEANWRSRAARQLPASEAATVELSPDAETQAVVRDPVAGMARVRGRILGAAAPQELVVRAFCESEPMPPNYEGLFRSVPDAQGRFELDAFVPGTWRLQAMRHGDVLGWQAIVLAAGDDAEAVLDLR